MSSAKGSAILQALTKRGCFTNFQQLGEDVPALGQVI
jgi:hypothetical protein